MAIKNVIVTTRSSNSNTAETNMGLNIKHLLKDVQNLYQAISVGSQGSLLKFPAQLVNILKAKYHYDLSPRFYSLYDLAITPSNEWAEYINNYRLKSLLHTINPEEHRGLVDNKFDFFKHCEHFDLPTIPILAIISPTESTDPLNGIELGRWNALLATAPSSLFIKRVDGTYGMDAFVAKRDTADNWNFLDRKGSLADLHQHCMRGLRDRQGWIVQPALKNASQLRSIMSPNALGTVRAITFLTDNPTSSPQLLCAILRLPTGNNHTDNFSHGNSGNLVAPIALDSGILGTARGSRNAQWPDMMNFDHHPDTGERIEGFVLPFWTELVRLVLKAQQALPQLPTLGWDIAITDHGPVIVETNASYDMDLIQVAYGKGFKTELITKRLGQHPRPNTTGSVRH